MMLYGPACSLTVQYGTFWSLLANYSPEWTCMVLYGPVWSHIVLFGPIWSCFVWVSMVLYGVVWSRMVSCGCVLFRMVLCGLLWSCRVLYGLAQPLIAPQILMHMLHMFAYVQLTQLLHKFCAYFFWLINFLVYPNLFSMVCKLMGFESFCQTRLPLGCSARLKILQLISFKIKPQRGCIMRRTPPTTHPPLPNFFTLL